jgi:uncharacterized protein YjbI with pentapeptide repeats
MKKVVIKKMNGDIIFSYISKNNSMCKTILKYIEVCKKRGKIADFSYADFSYADLRGVSFRGVSFRGVNFTNANFIGVNLTNADFNHADFSYADFSYADLRGVSFRGVSFRGVNFTNADFRKIDFTNADFRGVGFSHADFSYADFRWVNFINTDFREVDLRDANFSNTINFLINCPEEGSFIAYKKAFTDVGIPVIVVIRVEEDALRSSATSKKCRASKVTPLRFEDLKGNLLPEDTKVFSDYDNSFIYHIGKTIEVKNFDLNRWNKCSAGIHFFMNKHEAIHY